MKERIGFGHGEQGNQMPALSDSGTHSLFLYLEALDDVPVRVEVNPVILSFRPLELRRLKMCVGNFALR